MAEVINQPPVFSPAPAGRTFQLLLLTGAASAAAYARMVMSPLQETLQRALALSDNQIALLQGLALALPLAVATIPIGFLIDRYSRVRLLLILAVCNAISGFSTAMATGFVGLFVARGLAGLTSAATAMAAFSLIADLYAPAQRGRANMAIVLGQIGGMSSAFALGGLLLGISGSGPDGWRWAMAELSAPLALVIFALMAMREPARTERIIENSSVREALIELWRHRKLIAPLLIGWIVVGMADTAVLIWAGPMLSRSFALAPDRVGSIMAIVVLLSGVLGAIVGGIVADLCQRAGGPRRTIAALSGLTFLSAPAGLFAVMPGVLSATVLLVMFVTMGNAIGVAATTVSTVAIPNELRGICLGVLNAASGPFVLGIAPLSVSLLSAAIGGAGMIGKALSLVCVTVSVFGAAIFVIGSRAFPLAVLQ